jgi:hypothetical protein
MVVRFTFGFPSAGAVFDPGRARHLGGASPLDQGKNGRKTRSFRRFFTCSNLFFPSSFRGRLPAPATPVESSAQE